MRTRSGNLLLRKSHSKTFNRGIALLKRPPFVAFKNSTEFLSSYLIISKHYARITSEEIESARKVIRRLTNKRFDKIFVRVYPFIGLTKKPTQARMGRGKGARSGELICYVKPGKVLFEIRTTRRRALTGLYQVYRKICPRLSLETIFIRKKKILFS